MATDLMTQGELEALLKLPEGALDEDAYTALVMRAASEKVRATAEQPNWVGSEPTGDEIEAPRRAKDIALWLAKQVWKDPGNLQRRTAGPISSTYFEGGLRGLTLSKEDADWLERQGPRQSTGDLWMMRHYGTTAGYSATYGDETPDGYSFGRGDWNFAHGMVMGPGPDGGAWLR